MKREPYRSFSLPLLTMGMYLEGKYLEQLLVKVAPPEFPAEVSRGMGRQTEGTWRATCNSCKR